MERNDVLSHDNGLNYETIDQNFMRLQNKIRNFLFNPILNGEGTLPVRTLNVDNFFKKQPKATKFGDFS